MGGDNTKVIEKNAHNQMENQDLRNLKRDKEGRL
jgi:hypothetical protein